MNIRLPATKPRGRVSYVINQETKEIILTVSSLKEAIRKAEWENRDCVAFGPKRFLAIKKADYVKLIASQNSMAEFKKAARANRYRHS